MKIKHNKITVAFLTVKKDEWVRKWLSEWVSEQMRECSKYTDYRVA